MKVSFGSISKLLLVVTGVTAVTESVSQIAPNFDFCRTWLTCMPVSVIWFIRSFLIWLVLPLYSECLWRPETWKVKFFVSFEFTFLLLQSCACLSCISLCVQVYLQWQNWYFAVVLFIVHKSCSFSIHIFAFATWGTYFFQLSTICGIGCSSSVTHALVWHTTWDEGYFSTCPASTPCLCAVSS